MASNEGSSGWRAAGWEGSLTLMMVPNTHPDRLEVTREQLLVVKLGFALVVILASAVVLWARGTSDSLLASDSLAHAIFTVVIWAFPALAFYLFAAWSVATVVVDGVLLTALFVITWWFSATDPHSTASLGPALAGWFVGPTIILTTALVVAGVRRFGRR